MNWARGAIMAGRWEIATGADNTSYDQLGCLNVAVENIDMIRYMYTDDKRIHVTVLAAVLGSSSLSST